MSDLVSSTEKIVSANGKPLRILELAALLRYQTQAPSVFRVAVEKDIALEPNKETVVTAWLNSTDTVGVAGVFEPRHQVLMARVVARPTPTGQVPLRVVNLSAHRINVLAGRGTSGRSRESSV